MVKPEPVQYAIIVKTPVGRQRTDFRDKNTSTRSINVLCTDRNVTFLFTDSVCE